MVKKKDINNLNRAAGSEGIADVRSVKWRDNDEVQLNETSHATISSSDETETDIYDADNQSENSFPTVKILVGVAGGVVVSTSASHIQNWELSLFFFPGTPFPSPSKDMHHRQIGFSKLSVMCECHFLW